MEHVDIYTDGGSLGNPGPGGYGVILVKGDHRREMSAGFRKTTNNRMEILAAIAGLEALKRACDVTLYSDSRYLVDAIEKGWAKKWRSKGWRRNSRDKALNPDLWERLLHCLEKHRVRFVWVRGHSGHAENERCDQLVKKAAGQSSLPADVGYEQGMSGH